jgi:serine/threonine protein kinase
VGATVMDQAELLRAALADRYEFDREIGAGGMAHVYRARDRQHDRDVAIEVLKPELAAAVGTERFLREIHIAARLQDVSDNRQSRGLTWRVA